MRRSTYISRVKLRMNQSHVDSLRFYFNASKKVKIYADITVENMVPRVFAVRKEYYSFCYFLFAITLTFILENREYILQTSIVLI